MEKRFAYIRKHYDRVSKKLTITDDLANDGPFAKCPGTQGGHLATWLEALMLRLACVLGGGGRLA